MLVWHLTPKGAFDDLDNAGKVAIETAKRTQDKSSAPPSDIPANIRAEQLYAGLVVVPAERNNDDKNAGFEMAFS